MYRVLLERAASSLKGKVKDAVESVPTARQRPSALVDTRVIYCRDNLEQLKKLPDACVDLSYIDPPFNFRSCHGFQI